MKYEQTDVPPDVEAHEPGPGPVLDRDHLAEQHARVLHHEVARLERGRHVVRREVARDDRRVRVEVDRLLVVTGDPAEPAADVHLADRAARVVQPVEERGRVDQRLLEARELVTEPARARVEVERVHDERVAARGLDRVVEPVRGDPELRRPLTRIREMLRVAGPGAGVDPEPDGATRRATPDAFDLAHGVEVEPDRVGEEDVEVTLGDVGPGVADLRGLPAVGERVEHLARRAGVDPHGVGAAPAPRALG